MADVGSGDDSGRSPKINVGNELAGSTVSGGVVQAGVIHGDINLGAVPGFEPPRVPRQLPAPPTHFTNRAAELTALDSLLDPATSRLAPEVVVVTGFAGVGKTALALRWAAAHLDRFTGGQLFADLAGVGAAKPASVSRTLGAFLRSAGFPLHQIPADEAERAALWRSWTAQQAVLVVLDNAHSAAQVRALIPGSATSVVLVTSRKRLAGLVQGGARSVEVAPLDMRSGLELLRRSIGGSRVERESDQARRLVSLCGGLPIAVCVAAAQLSSRPVRSIQGAVRDLSRRGSRLAVLSQSEELSVRAVFDSSYHDLPAEPARLYRLASLHPGDAFGYHAAAVLADAPLAEATRLLDVLVDANLLQETSEDRYQFHDLVRQHAHEQAEAAGEAGSGSTVRTRICEWYLRAARAAVLAATGSRRRKEYAFTTTAPAFVLPEELESVDGSWAWLDVEQDTIVAAMKSASGAGRPELAWHLADVTRPLLRVGSAAPSPITRTWTSTFVRLVFNRSTGPTADLTSRGASSRPTSAKPIPTASPNMMPGTSPNTSQNTSPTTSPSASPTTSAGTSLLRRCLVRPKIRTTGPYTVVDTASPVERPGSSEDERPAGAASNSLVRLKLAEARVTDLRLTVVRP